jgi:hypothetical protein
VQKPATPRSGAEVADREISARSLSPFRISCILRWPLVAHSMILPKEKKLNEINDL